MSAQTFNPLNETYYNVAEVAEILGSTRWTVTRRFEKHPGVIDLGSPERCHKRPYRELRIPRSAVNKFIIDRRVDAPKRPSASASTGRRAVRWHVPRSRRYAGAAWLMPS